MYNYKIKSKVSTLIILISQSNDKAPGCSNYTTELKYYGNKNRNPVPALPCHMHYYYNSLTIGYSKYVYNFQKKPKKAHIFIASRMRAFV